MTIDKPNYYTVSQKTVQNWNCFCHNYVKFLPTFIQTYNYAK